MHRILLPLGAIAAFAVVVWSVGLTADSVRGLSGTRIGDTRTPVPGAKDVELDSGRYTVFYEVDEDSLPTPVGDGDAEVPVPPLDLTIRRGGDGEALRLEDYGGSFDVTSGGRAATAVRSISVPEDGSYRIRVGGQSGAESPAVVLGKPITRRVLRLLFALAALASGVALGALVTAVAVALRRRGRAAAAG